MTTRPGSRPRPRRGRTTARRSPLLLRHGPAEAVPERGLEQRVHRGGRDRAVGHLVLRGPGPAVADHDRARRVLGRRPVEHDLRLELAGLAPAVHALDATEQDDVVLAPADRGAELG